MTSTSVRRKTFPLSPIQSYFVETIGDPATTQPWRQLFHIAQAIQIEPGVSERRLSRAFDKLLKRHDVLRLRFLQFGGRWQAEMFDSHPTGMTVTEFGPRPDDEIAEIVRERGATMIPVDDPALITLDLMRFGKGKDVVLLRVHHAIADGYGMSVIAEDLIRLLANIPMPAAPMQHAEYLAHVGRAAFSDTEARKAYWDEIVKDAPKPAAIGEVGRTGTHGGPRYLRAEVGGLHDARLAAQEFKQLSRAAAEADCTPYAFFVAAFATAVHEICGADDIYVTFQAARSDGPLSRYAGAHLAIPMLRCRMSDGDTLVARAQAIGHQVRQAYIHQIKEQSWPFASRIDREIAEQGGWTEQFHVHIASADGRAKASMFRDFLRAAAGEVLQIGPLKVTRLKIEKDNAAFAEFMTVMVPNESGASVSTRYDYDGYTDREAERLVETMLNHLRAL